MNEPAGAPPYLRIGPERPASPVVLSVPHAGRDYSSALLRTARVPRYTLESLEDRLVDRLIWKAVAAGATAIVAQIPRAEIDLNRDEREIDPALIHPPMPPSSTLPSARTRGGIGLIPTRITGIGSIWNDRIPRAELERRLDQVHRPYHEALDAALEETKALYGSAVLLDCHSMPPRAGDGEKGMFVVLGDRHGASCAPELVDAAAGAAEMLGYRVARNIPYAGGHISGRHGRPEKGVHALQLEIDRSGYLDEALRAPGPGFSVACDLIAHIVFAIEGRLLRPDLAQAAE